MQISKRQKVIFNDIMSGLSLAPLIIVDSLGLGLLVFAPLGPSYIEYGIYTGLTGGFVSMLLITLFRSKVPLISYPSTITSVILFGFVSSARKYHLSERMDMDNILVMVMLIIICASIFQLIFAVTNLTQVIRKIDRSVLVGALNGMGILIIVAQVPTLLGIALNEITGVEYVINYTQPWTLAVGLITILALFSARHWVKRYRFIPPVLMVGMGIGIGVYYYISYTAVEPNLGPHISEFHYSHHILYYYLSVFQSLEWTYILSFLPIIILTAFTIAIFTTIQNYMCMTKAYPNVSAEIFNHESLKQSIGNVFTSLTGGLNGAASIGATQINSINNGQTRLVNYVCVFSVIICIFFFKTLIESIPYIVVGSIFTYIGLTYICRDSFRIYGYMFIRRKLKLKEKQHGILTLVTTVFVLGIELPIALLLSIGLSYIMYLPKVETFLASRK